MRLRIDRSLPTPLRQQIRAAIIDAVASGVLPAGAPLPSVRELAATMNVAPMTITKVYADLKAADLIAARAGSGTFVADSVLTRMAMRGDLVALRDLMDGLVDRAGIVGIAPGDVVSLLTLHVMDRNRSTPRMRIVMAGLFPDATQHYARCVAEQLGERAVVTPVVLGAGEHVSQDGAVAALRQADLVLTFASLRDRVEAAVPDARVLSLRFIPAEATRMTLAALDPTSRVVIVSRFADYLPVLTLGVRRFAAHVRSVRAFDMDAPELAAALSSCDVVVISTGAETAAALAPTHARRIEFRHVPDPGDVERLVAPLVAETSHSAAGDRKEAL